MGLNQLNLKVRFCQYFENMHLFTRISGIRTKNAPINQDGSPKQGAIPPQRNQSDRIPSDRQSERRLANGQGEVVSVLPGGWTLTVASLLFVLCLREYCGVPHLLRRFGN